MPTSPLNRVVQHLRADFRPDGNGKTDAELLARFVRSRDDTALAALIRRHAPMVWGVCGRLLFNHHDAEDAFQATFLVLVRKAATVPRQAVASWLYGVARQTAVRLRATAAKRGQREKQVATMPEPISAAVPDADWHGALDEELGRLPAHYRGVLILCELEGLTRKEAARQLDIPEGSVASRLARARLLLAKRLTQRGVVFSGGSVAALLAAGSAAASAPPALVACTIQVARLLAAGQAAGVSARVAAVTEGMVKAMFVNQLRSALTVLLVLLGLSLATFGLSALADGGSDPQPRAPIMVATGADGNVKKKQGEAQPPLTRAQKLKLLIDNVLAAHGGEDRLNKLKFIMTVKVDNGMTNQYFVEAPNHFRWESQHRDSPTKEICLLLPNGRMWWRKNPNEAPKPFYYSGAEPTMDFWIDYVKFFGPRQVLRLKDPGHQITLLEEEVKIDGRPAIGVLLKDKFQMYFDRETHLLVKQGETYYCDYRMLDGFPIPRKEKHPHAGTGAWEAEIINFQLLDKFDPKLFEQP